MNLLGVSKAGLRVVRGHALHEDDDGPQRKRGLCAEAVEEDLRAQP